MSQAPTYNRIWLWSKSCGTITGATLIVNAPPPTVTDSNLGNGFYSVQFQAINLEGIFMQNLVQFQPSATIWQTGYGTITATTGFSLERLSISYPFALAFGFDVAGKMLASFTQLNQNMNDVGGPYTKELSVKATSKGIRNLNFIAGGYGGMSSATFAKGTAFDFSLYVQGITDLTADGVQFLQGRGVPTICGASGFPQTAENSNLSYRQDGLFATQAKVKALIL